MTVFAALAISIRLSAQEQQDHPSSTHQPTIVTFDAPGAGAGPGQGTEGIAINPAGVIAGAYTDASGVNHGFLRAPDGTFATFDAPGAGTGPSQGTFVAGVGAITPAGAIVGTYLDKDGVNHGFLRAPDGTFTTFDIPGAGTGPGKGTLAEDINPEGVIAGEYSDASNVFHGFVRTEDGTITTFDVLGAGTGPGQGTFVASVEGLTPAGALAGYYTDQSGVNHGYVRAPHGTITTFDVAGAGTGPSQGTFVGGINPEGTVMSIYVDPNNTLHGYVRAPHGAITTFDILGAGTSPGQGTFPQAINTPGTIIGNYYDVNGVSHGFIRAKHGAITVFDVPGAGTGPGQGTIPFCNNPADAITGWEIDASGVSHGFLRIHQTEENGGHRESAARAGAGITSFSAGPYRAVASGPSKLGVNE
jgi:hypothetical protein